jgi:DNA repair protein RecO
MHHIYHTEGLILGSNNFGESGKYYHIFTRGFGLITASAQGVRKMSSKLRFVLQDFAYIKIDLVRGKDFWRVTSASKTNMLGNLSKIPEALRIVVNISLLLRRLLAGEDTNEILFADLLKGLSILEKSTKEEEFRNIEMIIVLRLLNNLGYIGGNKIPQTLTKSPFEEDLIFEVSDNRALILSQINKALKESHL